jgi:hypothetical protein
MADQEGQKSAAIKQLVGRSGGSSTDQIVGSHRKRHSSAISRLILIRKRSSPNLFFMFVDYDAMYRHFVLHFTLVSSVFVAILASESPTDLAIQSRPTADNSSLLTAGNTTDNLNSAESLKALLFQSKRKQRPRMLGTLYTNIANEAPNSNVQIKYFDGNSLLGSLVLRPTMMATHDHPLQSINPLQSMAYTPFPMTTNRPHRYADSYGSSEPSFLTGQSVPAHTLHTLLQQLLLSNHDYRPTSTVMSGRPIPTMPTKRKKVKSKGRPKSVIGHSDLNVLQLAAPPLSFSSSLLETPLMQQQWKQMEAFNSLATLQGFTQMSDPLMSEDPTSIDAFPIRASYQSTNGRKPKLKDSTIDSLISKLMEEAGRMVGNSDSYSNPYQDSYQGSYHDSYQDPAYDLESSKPFNYPPPNYSNEPNSDKFPFAALDSALGLADNVSIEQLLRPLVSSHRTPRKKSRPLMLTTEPESDLDPVTKEPAYSEEYDSSEGEAGLPLSEQSNSGSNDEPSDGATAEDSGASGETDDGLGGGSTSGDYDYAKYAPDAVEDYSVPEDGEGGQPSSSPNPSEGKGPDSSESRKSDSLHERFRSKTPSSSAVFSARLPSSDIVQLSRGDKISPNFEEILRRKNLQTGFGSVSNRPFLPRNK